ncbi:MAG: hypothetical protein ACLVGL_17445 [Waltera sp.]
MSRIIVRSDIIANMAESEAEWRSSLEAEESTFHVRSGGNEATLPADTGA